MDVWRGGRWVGPIYNGRDRMEESGLRGRVLTWKGASKRDMEHAGGAVKIPNVCDVPK